MEKYRIIVEGDAFNRSSAEYVAAAQKIGFEFTSIEGLAHWFVGTWDEATAFKAALPEKLKYEEIANDPGYVVATLEDGSEIRNRPCRQLVFVKAC